TRRSSDLGTGPSTALSLICASVRADGCGQSLAQPRPDYVASGDADALVSGCCTGVRLRRYHFHSSESRTTENGTIKQTPHWARVRPVVWRKRLKTSISVPRTIAAIDMPLKTRSFRSENDSMLKIVPRSSRA